MRRDFGKVHFQPEKSKEEKIFSTFGPEYRIEMRIIFLEIPSQTRNAFSLRPRALSLDGNAVLILDHPEFGYNTLNAPTPNMAKDTPYDIIMEQKLKSGKLIYEITINREIVLTEEITSPKTYLNQILRLSESSEEYDKFYFDYLFIHSGHGKLINYLVS